MVAQVLLHADVEFEIDGVTEEAIVDDRVTQRVTDVETYGAARERFE